MPPLASFAEGSYDGINEVLSNVFPAMKHDLLVSRFLTWNRVPSLDVVSGVLKCQP